MSVPIGPPIWQLFYFDGVGHALIDGVQSVNMTKGRRLITDNYSSGRATITGTFASSLPNITVGTPMRLRLAVPIGPGTFAENIYNFRLADLRIVYGIVPTEDVWEIDLEDAFAQLGRAKINTTLTSGMNVATAAQNVVTAAGLTFNGIGSTTTTTNAQTLTEQNALEVFQNLANTEQAYVLAGGDEITWYSRNSWINSPYASRFSDTDSTAGPFGTLPRTLYSGLQKSGIADNYANKVVAIIQSGVDAVAGSGEFSFSFNTYSGTVAQAEDAASWMLGTLDVQENATNEFTFLLNNQKTEVLFVLEELQSLATVVQFRGDTYDMQVLGFRISANPNSTTATVYVASKQFFAFFELDNPTMGVLDQNKLGW